jgi:DHA1 family inner membrane transport protein
VVDQASEAPNLASTLNIGNAAGAFLGGAIIEHGLPFTAVPLAGALMALAGLAVTLSSAALEMRGRLATLASQHCQARGAHFDR